MSKDLKTVKNRQPEAVARELLAAAEPALRRELLGYESAGDDSKVLLELARLWPLDLSTTPDDVVVANLREEYAAGILQGEDRLRFESRWLKTKSQRGEQRVTGSLRGKGN